MSSETKENEEIIEETHLPNDYGEELIDDAEMENAGGNENDFSVNNQAVDETNSGGNRDSDADEAGEANVIEGNGREEDELSESHRENNSSDSADVNLIEGDDKKQEGSSEPNCESNSSGNADDTADVDLIEGDDKKQDGSFEPRCEPVIDANTSVNGSEIDGLVGEAEADVIEESKNISEQKMALYGKEFENGENAKKRKSVDNGMEFENGVFVRKFEEETTKKRKSEVNGMYVARGMVLARAERNIMKQEMVVHEERVGRETPKTPCPFGPDLDLEELSGTEEEQVAFLTELESFYREEKNSDFKPLKFYGKELNCLQLWKAVTRLGGYDQVTGCKLWKHVGGTFNPPKTCTTVSWTFRGFYEKALLDYERYKTRDGDGVPFAPLPDSMSVESQIGASQPSGSGRVRRESATRAMQGWHSQRLLANGEVGDPVIKDKSIVPMPMHEKQIETDGAFKSKKLSNIERGTKSVHTTPKASKLQMDIKIDHIGPPADWVKINVRRTKDCFEVYALVPGLLREEVRVQSDPAGRLVISGEPEKPDNPWGVTPFKKVVTLPSRIDPVHTSAVVTLHGQLFVRAPFEQSYK